MLVSVSVVIKALIGSGIANCQTLLRFGKSLLRFGKSLLHSSLGCLCPDCTAIGTEGCKLDGAIFSGKGIEFSGFGGVTMNTPPLFKANAKAELRFLVAQKGFSRQLLKLGRCNSAICWPEGYAHIAGRCRASEKGQY